jgi:4-hydroxybenzoate polyprenyltransferase
MNKLRSIIAITRLNRPIGIYLLIYPSLIAFIFASQLLTNAEIMTPKSLNILLYKSLAIIIIGAILVRSTGCVINDIFDRKFDKDVERTNDRPLASGVMSLNEANKLPNYFSRSVYCYHDYFISPI